MKPKKYCEYCKYLGYYPNGKARCERTKYVQPFVEREQEACDKFESDESDKRICGNCAYYECGKNYVPYCNYVGENGRYFVKADDSCECFELKQVIP